jgi:phage terminase large subunit GpA-like protein
MTQVYIDAFLKGIRPDEDLGVGEWAEKFRMLSQKGAAEPGPYRLSRTPYLRGIAKELSQSSPIQRVVFMKPVQVGASELMFTWLGSIMHSTPGPSMLVQPTTELMEKVSKQRIASMIEETPCLRELIGPEKSRTSGQTVLLKEFPGGVLSMVGANSPVGLRSMPVRFLGLDEVDAYPHDVGGEGDPVSLAEKRTTTFARRKIFITSTPTIKDTSRIEIEFNNSDQRRYFVPCPHCGSMQWLKFKQLTWVNDDPTTTVYKCEHCSELIPERYKTQMMEDGDWQATAPGDGKTAGFHLNALYSPVGWMSWASIVDEFLKSKNDAPKLKTFVNTILGETWEEEYAAKVGAGALQARSEDYPMGFAPAGVLIAIGSVDVQDNRLAISRYGYGKDEEAWLIDHQEIFGDISRLSDPNSEIHKQAWSALMSPIEHEIGEPLTIVGAACDSGGHYTHEVYQFCRTYKKHRFIAVKGASQKGKEAIGKGKKVDINLKTGQALKYGGEVHLVGTDTIKSVIYGRLKHNEPGPGYYHFPQNAPDEYYAQLVAEKQVTRYVKGFPIREWTKKAGERNEALDTAVYNYAFLQFYLNMFNRKTAWESLEKRLVLKLEATKTDQKTGQNKPKQATISPSKRRFVTSW